MKWIPRIRRPEVATRSVRAARLTLAALSLARLDAASPPPGVSASLAGSADSPHTPAADLIITHAYVVTMDGPKTIHPDGAVVIRAGRILAVGPSALADRFRAPQTIDAHGDILMPGMINAHTHASMSVFRGLADDVPDRLTRYIFPLEKKMVNRQLVYWGGLYGMIEMVEGGVTTIADMYYFEDEVARAAQQLGLRGYFGETVINFADADSPEPYGGMAYARKFIHDFKGDPLVTPAFAPHAPYSVDAAHLREIVRAADELDVPILMHVAEMPYEVADTRREHNQTPIEYLDSVGMLNRHLVAAHCIFVTDSDIALMKLRDIGISHNMVANIKSAKGVSPAVKMFDQGLRIGLGSDGPMSGNTLDIIGQLGYVAKVQKLATKDRNVMPAVKVVEMATMGGARALHLEHQIGSVEPGKFADLILLSREATTMIPFYDVYSTLVYAASPRDVRTTIVAGRILMRDRRIQTVDVAEVRAHMQRMMATINAVAERLK
jgi:cytosine/adenosine deaminase-related metal-dependent hydrolase